MVSSTLKNKAKAKVAVRKRRKERESLVKSVLSEISVPEPINGTNGENGRDGRDGKDGRDAPTIDEILLKIPKQEFDGVTAIEFEDMFKAALDKELPKLEDKFRPKVELIREEIPKDKLDSFITKKELDKVLRRVEEAIVYHSGGGGQQLASEADEKVDKLIETLEVLLSDIASDTSNLDKLGSLEDLLIGMADNIKEIREQDELLNARVEEAFETSINKEDI